MSRASGVKKFPCGCEATPTRWTHMCETHDAAVKATTARWKAEADAMIGAHLARVNQINQQSRNNEDLL